jgi:hypothetical protein
MKILVAMPCFGGQMFTRTSASLITTMLCAKEEGLFHIQPHFQGDSLIHRARDRAAMYMITEGYDKIFTIDADVTFTYEDFKRIALSPEPIVGGAYPIKNFPVVLNFIPMPDRGTELFSSERHMDYDAFQKFKEKYADPDTGLASVARLATGFLCCTREVFEKLGETSDMYVTQSPETGEIRKFMHFYTSGVHESVLESEDFSLCRRAIEAGFKVMFDTRVVLGHIGLHEYRLGQFFGTAGT